jgi:hypothetical protein
LTLPANVMSVFVNPPTLLAGGTMLFVQLPARFQRALPTPGLLRPTQM